jgi:hypothetical protein
MNAFIDFIMGPMVWISALVFLFGLVFKLVKIILEIREKENFIFSYMSLKYSLRLQVPKSGRFSGEFPIFFTFFYLLFLCFSCPILSCWMKPLGFSGWH